MQLGAVFSLSRVFYFLDGGPILERYTPVGNVLKCCRQPLSFWRILFYVPFEEAQCTCS